MLKGMADGVEDKRLESYKVTRKPDSKANRERLTDKQISRGRDARNETVNKRRGRLETTPQATTQTTTVTIHEF